MIVSIVLTLDVKKSFEFLDSGAIDVRRSIWFRLCKETGHDRPLLADGRAGGAAAAALSEEPRQAEGG